MSTYIELEIQNLLKEVHDLDDVAERLIRYLKSHPDNLTPENISALSRFLINANLHSVLVNFVLQYIEDKNFPIPWAYFLEALGSMKDQVDEKIVLALAEGIAEQNAESEASRSQAMSALIPKLNEWRSQRKYKIHQEYLENKSLLLEQLITLRTQQLFAQEKKLLVRLEKLYPQDPEILLEVREHKQRHALDVLQRRSPKPHSLNVTELLQREPEVEAALQALLSSLQEQAQQHPEMAFDFAIIAFMLECYEAALSLLDYSEDSEARLWLRLEILLRGNRFIELLNDLTSVELMLAHEPETFFATAYYRAQALWGIGQKHAAIEVLEGLLAARPNYRAAGTLLTIWSSQ